MKRILLTGVFTVACYLFFLISQCPVARVLPWLPLPPGLVLSGPSGTLWQGDFEQVMWRGKLLQKVGWHLPLSSVLLFDPVIELSFKDRNTLQGQAELGWASGIRWRDVDLRADAAWLLSQAPMPLPVPVTATGDVRLQLAELIVTPQQCVTLAGNLLWRGAEVQSPMGALRLDDARAQLSCEQGKWVAKVQQDSPQLKLNGRAELDFKGNYSVQGTLTPGVELPPSFAQGMNFLGQRDSQGAIRLNYVGRL